MGDRLVGRVVCEDIHDPVDANRIIVSANEEFSEELASAVDQAGVKRVKVRSVLTCESKHGVCIHCYGRNLATGTPVKLGEAVGIIAAQSIGEPGTQLTMRTFHTGGTASQTDITKGLQCVTELFEAPRAENASKRSQIRGVVTSIADVLERRCIIIKDPRSGVEKRHYARMSEEVLVKQGDHVRKGQRLTNRETDLHKPFESKGLEEFQEHFVQAVQEVYRPRGATINDKHIEVIVRQMLRKVSITDAGGTTFSTGDLVDKLDFEEENQRVEELGRKPSEAKPILLGITNASLQAKSFLSAASFQNTTQVLTDAAAMSKRDDLLSLNGHVITGRVIPAGTGYDLYRQVRLKPLAKTENEAGPVVRPGPKP